MNEQRILRKQEVKRKTGLPNSTIYELISQGKFPKQIKLSTRSSGWLESEIDEWIAAKVSERDCKVVSTYS